MRTLLLSAAAVAAFAVTAPAFAQTAPQDSALAPSVNDTATPPRTNPDAAGASAMGAGMGGDASAAPAAAPIVSSTTTTVVAPSAGANGQDVSATLTDQMISNGPVPDTAANRAKYGSPLSHAGKLTKAAGN